MKKWIVLTAIFSFLTIFSNHSLFADEMISGSKLDQLLQNQERILKELAEIRSELQVIKVRSTR